MSLRNWKKKLLSLGLAIVLLFALLIYKDPFSQRTLIPNFEPYPDTFFYINPAMSLSRGDGFNIIREGMIVKPNVPPLYSIILTPVFFIKQDPRMSYYTNVILAFVSLLLFWAILQKLFVNKLVILLLLVLYITNYFIYWVPTLIMAENLTLTIYLAIILLLLSKTTVINSVVISFLAVAVYATKYASIPVTLSVLLLYFIKILFPLENNLNILKKSYKVLPFFGALIFFLLALAGLEQLIKNNDILAPILKHLSSIYNSAPQVATQNSAAASSSWFGVQYISKNLPLYINSLMGNSNRFLWDQTPLVPKFVAICGWLGIFGGLLYKKTRFIAFSLILLLSSSVIFMSAFYSFDARYIYVVIPSLLIGLGLFFACIEEKVGINKKIIINFLILFAIGIYLINSFTRIKSQISLNLRYAETPWNYISVLKTNEYFTSEKVVSGKKPILISALPPYLVDYYSNGNYTLLPLAYQQEFRSFRESVWGDQDYSNLPNLYKNYLKKGFNLYVSRSGLGNEGYTNRDFNTIVKEFDTKLVQPGCYDQCNIYSVKLKDRDDR